MRKTLLPALAVALLLGTSHARPAQAQESPSTGLKPVLTVSVSGFDAFKKDLEWLGQVTGTPELAKQLEAFGPEGLPGLDASKPWGAVVHTDGQDFPWYAFAPVSDLKQLLSSVAKLPDAPPIPEPDADGIYELQGPDPGQQVFLQQKGNWAFLADSRETLAKTPSDPVPALGGMNESYALGVRVVVKNVPSGTREEFLMPIQFGLAMGQQRMPDETDQQYALRSQMTARSLEELTKLVNETDTLQLGLAVEPQSNALRLDIDITAIQGTSSAEEYALLGDSKSDLAGFYVPEAALTLLWAGTMPESDVAQMKDTLDVYASKAMEDLDQQDLSDAERKLAKQILGDLIDVVQQTVASRRVDAGLALSADSGSLNLVTGSFVADAAKLEKLVKQLAQLVMQEENPPVAKWITLDAEEHQGVRLHTFAIPADELPPELKELPAMIVGQKLTAVVGFGDQHAYLAAGPQAVELLKKAVDASKAAAGQPVAPFRLSLSAGAIGRIVEGAAAPEDLGPGMLIVQMLKQAGQKDHLTVAIEAVPNGMRTRVQFEEGMLKVIGMAVNMVMSQFAPGGGMPGQPPF